MSNRNTNQVLFTSLVLLAAFGQAHATQSSSASGDPLRAGSVNSSSANTTAQSAGAQVGIGAGERKSQNVPPFTSASAAGALGGAKGGAQGPDVTSASASAGGIGASAHSSASPSIVSQGAGAQAGIGAAERKSQSIPPFTSAGGTSTHSGSGKVGSQGSSAQSSSAGGLGGVGSAGRRDWTADSAAAGGLDALGGASDRDANEVPPFVSAGGQSATSGKGRGGVSGPISVIERGQGLGELFIEDLDADVLSGSFYDRAGNERYAFDGIMTRVYAASLIPFERPWGFVQGDLYEIDPVHGTRTLIGELDGEWESFGAEGRLWGALIDQANGADMGLFRGEYRLLNAEVVGEGYRPTGASQHGQTPPDPLGPPVSTVTPGAAQSERPLGGGGAANGSTQTQAGGVQAGAHDGADTPDQSDGVVRIEWEIWG